MQKRIDELTANWRSEQRRAENLQSLLEQTLRLNHPQQVQQQPQPELQVKQPPKLEDFNFDEAAWQQAVIDHKVAERLDAVEAQRKQQQAEEARRSEAQRFMQEASQAESKYPGITQMLGNPALPISGALFDAVMASKHRVDLAYQIASNPAKAFELSNMQPWQIGMELARMEFAISTPPQPKPSAAPDPVKPVANGPAAPRPDPTNVADWIQRRRQEIGRR